MILYDAVFLLSVSEIQYWFTNFPIYKPYKSIIFNPGHRPKCFM